MPTMLVVHEVDDVDRWISSPKRQELMGPLGITMRLFRDPQGSNCVAMILEIPDMAAFQELIDTDPSSEAAKADDVRVDTAAFLVEA
jgi:hypothetical protein